MYTIDRTLRLGILFGLLASATFKSMEPRAHILAPASNRKTFRVINRQHMRYWVPAALILAGAGATALWWYFLRTQKPVREHISIQPQMGNLSLGSQKSDLHVDRVNYALVLEGDCPRYNIETLTIPALWSVGDAFINHIELTATQPSTRIVYAHNVATLENEESARTLEDVIVEIDMATKTTAVYWTDNTTDEPVFWYQTPQTHGRVRQPEDMQNHYLEFLAQNQPGQA